MNSKFYSELIKMAADASVALDGFVSGPGTEGTFRTLQSVGVACLDGDKLNAGILEDLGPRQTMPFRTAVMELARLQLLQGGPGANQNVRNALYNIKQIATELRDNAVNKEQNESEGDKPATKSTQDSYIDPSRIAGLHSLVNPQWDVKRLIRLLEELNAVHAAGCHMSTAMLVRAIVDHVPPVFGLPTFAEVASNYGGGKSFKGSMQHLQGSLRHIADSHLHAQIRKSEVLPTARQVDFRSDVDVLIGEVTRVLQKPA